MTQRKLLFIDCPEHGWLRVTIEDLKELGIEDDISPFSYLGKHYAYLEEDLDAGTFLDSAEGAKWEVERETRLLDRRPVWFVRPGDGQSLGEIRRLVAEAISAAQGRAGKLTGKRVCLTGTLLGMTREDAVRAVEAAGGRVTSGVSGKTDYLVVGIDPGTKYDKAVASGVTVIDEEDLIALLS